MTNAYARPLVIGIIGDQTGASNIEHAYEIFEEGAKALKQRKPDIIFHVGDLIESRPDIFSCKPTPQVRKDITDQFKKGVKILSNIGIPWYLTPGDHDVNPCLFVQNSPDRSREKLFHTLYKAINPKVSNNLYYSFDIEDYHIISLYSQEHLHTDPRWGNVFLARLSEKQLAWLKEDLTRADSIGKQMVVFLHQPLWYNWTEWADIHEILQQYQTLTVVAGHFHYNQEQAKTGGFNYRTVGATGGDIKKASTNAGGIQHVTLLTLDKNKTLFEIIPLGETTGTAVSFTQRKHMDWMQSLDINLGNAWEFAKDNPLFFKGNVLVNDCDSNNSAIIHINKVGNPTRVPVKTKISLLYPEQGLRLSNGKFSNNVCLSQENPTNCTLMPSALIGESNVSSVKPALGATYLWRGNVIYEGDLTQPNKLHLRVTMTVSPNIAENLSIYKDLSTEIKVCVNPDTKTK